MLATGLSMKPVRKIGRVVNELFVLESLFSAVAKLSEEVSEELTGWTSYG